jgi:hypothetical protein
MSFIGNIKRRIERERADRSKRRDENLRTLKEEQEKKRSETKEVLVHSIGGQPAKIDADVKQQSGWWNLMEHIDTSGEMYPVTVSNWKGHHAIVPLGNLVLGLPPDAKVAQIKPGRDYTRKNLTAMGTCEPETFTTQQEMRQRYVERCAKFRKKFVN